MSTQPTDTTATLYDWKRTTSNMRRMLLHLWANEASGCHRSLAAATVPLLPHCPNRPHPIDSQPPSTPVDDASARGDAHYRPTATNRGRNSGIAESTCSSTGRTEMARQLCRRSLGRCAHRDTTSAHTHTHDTSGRRGGHPRIYADLPAERAVGHALGEASLPPASFSTPDRSSWLPSSSCTCSRRQRR